MSKAGVVLCRCNSIIDGRIDFEQLNKKLAADKKVQAVIQVDMACSPRGKKTIRELAAMEEVDRLVVAACSPFSKGAVFDGFALEMQMPKQLIELVNLREHCAWAHEIKDADKKALTLIKMGLKKVLAARDLGQWSAGCAHVNKLKCDRCKRCIEECPNRAIQLGADGYPAADPAICQRCGICVGGCPLGVIALPDFRLEEVSAMLAPLSSGQSPVIAGFFCNFAYQEADLMGQIGRQHSPGLHIIRVPCTGAVNMITVNDAIAEGIDGIMVVGCDSSQCKHRKGNELAKYRIANCRKGLEEQLLEQERLVYVSLGEGLVEPSVINRRKCVRCGLCAQICPYGAIKITDSGDYEVNARACRGCGACAGACRSGAVDLPQASGGKIMAAIKSALAG